MEIKILYTAIPFPLKYVSVTKEILLLCYYFLCLKSAISDKFHTMRRSRHRKKFRCIQNLNVWRVLKISIKVNLKINSWVQHYNL